jgi:hypothetical protein
MKSVLLSLHYICEMSTIVELHDFFFNLEMTTIDPSILLINKFHLSTDFIVTIRVAVLIALIT